MKTAKYWLPSIVVFVLCITIAFAKPALDTSPANTQWEYARYCTTHLPSNIVCFSWSTPTEHFFTMNGVASDLWQKARFTSEDPKNTLIHHWFTFLGQQGWELIFMEKEDRPEVQDITYWFKRPKGGSKD